MASGIIESYVLGLASEKERAGFEQLLEKYPELKEARIRFELAMEDKAFANAVAPPAFLKTKIVEAIQQEKTIATVSPIVSIDNKKAPVHKLPIMRWAVAATVVLLLGSGVVVYILYDKNRELRSAVARSQKTTDKLDEQARTIGEKMLPEDTRIQQVKVVTPRQTIPATINVFGDSTSNNIYLIIKDLLVLPARQHYQLWAITKRKYTSMGFFDAPVANNKLILKMNNAKDADSFAVTIEKR
jgi:anti-sigma-K factor RskA